MSHQKFSASILKEPQIKLRLNEYDSRRKFNTFKDAKLILEKKGLELSLGLESSVSYLASNAVMLGRPTLCRISGEIYRNCVIFA